MTSSHNSNPFFQFDIPDEKTIEIHSGDHYDDDDTHLPSILLRTSHSFSNLHHHYSQSHHDQHNHHIMTTTTMDSPQNSSVVGFFEKFNHLLHNGRDDLWSEKGDDHHHHNDEEEFSFVMTFLSATTTQLSSTSTTQQAPPPLLYSHEKERSLNHEHVQQDSIKEMWDHSSGSVTCHFFEDGTMSNILTTVSDVTPSDLLVMHDHAVLRSRSGTRRREDFETSNRPSLEKLELLKLGTCEILRIFEFLIGDVSRAKSEMNSQFYWNIIQSHLHGHESEHDALLALFNLVPPKESVLSLRYLYELNKKRKIFHVTSGDEKTIFEFWKNVYVHFEKILCVFRSLMFTNMTLAMGRISWYEREQLANMQRLIVAHEMGMDQPLKVGETLEPFDDQVEFIDSTNDEYFSSQYLEKEFLTKFKRLELTPFNEQFIMQGHGDGMFNLAIFKMLQLSLKMFRDFDLDVKDLALPNNFRNSHVRFEMDIFNTRTRKLGFCMDYNSSFQFEVEKDEQDEIINNLSKYVILDLRDVTNFSKYLDFILPSEIQFLNFCSSIPYNYDLGNVSFSNVKYLRINIEGHHECDVGDEIADYGNPVFVEDTTSMFLREMLSTKRFPNLIHLVLRGAQSLSFLEEESGFEGQSVLSQLWFLELLINDDTNGFYGNSNGVETLRKITNRMSQLKQLILNVNLDVRRSSGVDYEKLKEIYGIGNGRFTVSVGRVSIARFCKYAFANVYQKTMH